MNRIFCSPHARLPVVINPRVDYFSMYSYPTPTRRGVGYVTPFLKRDIRRDGLAPSVRVWDFASIALSVAAADLSCKRANSADGWTRIIELDICLREPEPWLAQRTQLESTFRYLTGDFWKLNFLPGGDDPPKSNKIKTYDADCVSLLSGGVDSLVGAIELTSKARKPLFVSQVVRGDKVTQKQYASELGAGNRHCQWSGTIHRPRRSEGSTRGRSIVFFAFAAIAASAIPSSAGFPVEIFVPENGFISLNVPLNPGRMGSLSTKTTHPIYLSGIQSVWDAVGIHAKLISPYQFKTKGELLGKCSDKEMLLRLIGHSTSCGKFGRHKLTHCGRCLPCLVRRGAFLKSGLSDTTTKGYFFDHISKYGRESGPNDIGAVATAYLRYQAQGVRRFVGGALSFVPADQRSQYEGVVARGLDELGQLLINHGVI